MNMMNRELIKTIAEIDKKLKNRKLKELELRGIKGLAPSHGDILVNLFRSGSLSMRDLSEKIQRDKSTVTALINKLSKLGYVEKYKGVEDSRVNFVRLTPLAYERRYIFVEVADIIMEKFSRHVTEDEIKTVLDILTKINSGL